MHSPLAKVVGTEAHCAKIDLAASDTRGEVPDVTMRSARDDSLLSFCHPRFVDLHEPYAFAHRRGNESSEKQRKSSDCVVCVSARYPSLGGRLQVVSAAAAAGHLIAI